MNSIIDAGEVNPVLNDIMLAELVHDGTYLARLRDARPAEGIGQLDADTFISDGSMGVAATGLGGALLKHLVQQNS